MKNFLFVFAALLLSLGAVAALPPILGPSTICVTSSATLVNSVTGGTWTSSNPSLASIGASTGTVTGIAAGTVTITYTDGTDFAYSTLTVYSLPTAITGSLAICDGGSTTLGSTPAGGTWVSANSAIAPISASTGVATGVSAGITAITYTAPTGCTTTAMLTVNPIPSVAASTYVCISTPVTLYSSPAGGTWSIAPTSVATVNPATGMVSGLSLGTAVATYTYGPCSAMTSVTVNAAIGAISGPLTVCMPTTNTLTNSTPGGTWSSSNVAVAMVGATTGIVTGFAAGTTHITYSLGGCFNVVTVTVNGTPAAITGTASLCAGTTTTLTSSGGFGGSWSSGATSVATVGTGGVVFGAGVGTAGITYTLGACGSVTRVVTVTSSCSGTPVPGIVTASSSTVCSGTPLTLDLPTYTSACGHIKQWEYSADGFAWYDLPGANTVPYTYNPTASYYYRCRITCASSGLTASSGPVHVVVNFSIGSHSVISAPTTSCLPTHFYVAACGVSTAFNVTTYFGDGEFVSTALTGASPSNAHIYHTYSLPGTYTVKHVLRNGATAVDSVSFTYNYVFCRTLPIRFYMDNNSNCAFDAGDENNLVPVTVRIDSNGVPVDTITATSGLYYVALGGPSTIYAFRPLSVDGGLVASCPASGVIYDTITTFTNTYPAKYFGISCVGVSAFDLRVNATSRAGIHTQQITVTVRNNYCTSTPAMLTLNHSGKYGYFPGVSPCTYTSPAPTSYSGTSMTWNLGPIAGNSVRTIQIWLERTSAIGPWLTPGDTANYTLTVGPLTGDLVPGNNTFTKTDTVRSSFDPNDIAVAPEGNILPCTDLQYKVRFENTGNDTAHNIYVLDTLPVWLDASTIQPIVATHAMDIVVTSSGGFTVARFGFPNINLLDTSHHGLCDGMFIFKIRARSTVPDGTDITNRVGIYFDENPVVMTNEVNNTTGLPAIQGPDHICLGYPDTLFNSMAGGAWVSSTPATGTISALGIVTGIAAGTSTISYTVSNSCTSRTVTKTVTVAPIAVPSVSVITTDDTVCSGSPVIFTVSSVAGGTTPAYQWAVNGTVVGAGSAYSYMPLTGDNVSVIMTSSQACTLPSVVADTLLMTVLPTGTPVASVSVSPNDTSCAGTAVTFTATPIMGGTTPGYAWFVNGVVAGSGPSHMYVPANGDLIYCRMGSNYFCRLADTVNSVVIHQTVDPLYMPLISISASPSLTVNAGDPITFTATVAGAGPFPVYEWYVNSTIVPGAITNSFTTSTLSDYDSVTCRVTGSGVCNITTYNSVYVTILPAGVTNVSGDGLISVFPNPNNGGFRIKAFLGIAAGNEAGIVINNVLGQVVYSSVARVNAGNLDEVVQLPAGLANGVYMLNLRNGAENRTFRFVVDR